MKIEKQVSEINLIFKELDSVYHQMAKKNHLSDCAFWILYLLYDRDKSYSQNSLCEELSYSKQTINSTISKLKKDGFLTLQMIPQTRNRKEIILTERGVQVADEVIGKVKKIEYKAFSKLTEQERKLYLHLSRMFVENFNEEFSKSINIEKKKGGAE
ncbi:MAG: winged helix-turn-helix transcriptional regulator [Peptostreptococcaceae bacterium]|nr:winged helix-turn-helix transcriptional regulator [Peptostreptococcaceae bacterium]